MTVVLRNTGYKVMQNRGKTLVYSNDKSKNRIKHCLILMLCQSMMCLGAITVRCGEVCFFATGGHEEPIV